MPNYVYTLKLICYKLRKIFLNFNFFGGGGGGGGASVNTCFLTISRNFVAILLKIWLPKFE